MKASESILHSCISIVKSPDKKGQELKGVEIYFLSAVIHLHLSHCDYKTSIHELCSSDFPLNLWRQ